VALGLGLVAVVFTLLNAFIFRVDEVHNPHELFAVERSRSANAEPERFTRLQYESLVRETGVFSDAFAMTPEIDRWIDGQRMEGPFVTGNFFQVLGVSAARGRTLTPVDDEPGGHPAIVLSHRAWSRYFAGDPGGLSRIVLVDAVPFQVVGVMPEGFRGLSVAAPDFWMPLSVLPQLRGLQKGSEDAVDVCIVGRLKPGVSRGQALAELLAWDSRRAAERSGERPAANLVLEPRPGTVALSADIVMLFTPLFFAFGLILLIGCANVANLLLARAIARQREIGIRLAMGASRRRIMRQLLTESLLLALVSAALAFGISRLALAAALYAITSTWASAFGDVRAAVPPADWRVALFLFAGAVVSTLFFALAPALQATRLELVRAIRGEVVRDSRPGRARNVLVALQVTGAVLLLTCSAVFLRSTWAAASVDPGIRIADTVSVGILNEKMRGTMLDIVRSEPSIASIAASRPGGLGGRPALAEGTTGKSSVTYQLVSPEYFNVLGIDVVRGRGFEPNERSAVAAVAVVSERVASQLWPDIDPLGQVLRLEPDPKGETHAFVVVGIARNVAGFRFSGRGAGIYLPTGAETSGTALTMRVHGNPERVRRALIERMAAIDPNMGEVNTLRTIASLETYLLAIPFWLTLVLGALALLLTVSGLFSVLSYLVQQGIKELGVRMALGASGKGIAALVFMQSAKPVGIGLFVGVGLTAALGAALLATPAAGEIGSTVRLFDPLAYAASLLCIVSACACAALIPALRASRIDPVAALRQD
jgi:predicted permease